MSASRLYLLMIQERKQRLEEIGQAFGCEGMYVEDRFDATMDNDESDQEVLSKLNYL